MQVEIRKSGAFAAFSNFIYKFSIFVFAFFYIGIFIFQTNARFLLAFLFLVYHCFFIKNVVK